MLHQPLRIRPLTLSDLPQIKLIIEDSDMFPSELLDDMTRPYFDQTTLEQWFVVEREPSKLVAVAYCAPERMTQGTWNLLLIAVLSDNQGKGIGKTLMAFVEQTLMEQSARVLLVETSGLPDYQLTRAFYPKCGYTQMAVIPEYYDEGDDKIVFWKSLNSKQQM